MRKILMIVIILLLLGLGYITLMDGIKISTLQVLSIKQIEDESKNLKNRIEEINTLIDVEYPKKINELRTASNKMHESKAEYLKYTDLSTDAQILEAMQKKSYKIEFLWARLGTHAREEGVNLTFEITSSSTGANNVNDLKFTVNGSYIAIINFVYAIENDTELNFRIENFKMLPYQNEILQSTFSVKNIAIEGNTSTQSVTANQTNRTENTTKNTIENTTTTENNTNVENTTTSD